MNCLCKLICLLSVGWMVALPPAAKAQLFKGRPYDPNLEARILAHRCVEKVKFSSTLCGPAAWGCNADEIRVLMIVAKTAELKPCLEELQQDLPDLRFVRQYPMLRWIVAVIK